MSVQYPAQQHQGEIDRFIAILKSENVRSYLEIGSKFGGSLWQVATSLPHGSRIVSVDLPWGKRESEPQLRSCVADLQRLGYETHLFLDDSTNSDVVNAVRSLGPFDACFIDANHTEPFVRKDWANYGPMCRIVAFHDIGWAPRPMPSGKMPIEVQAVWNEIKGNFRHEEIRECPRDNGIGVLWRT